MMVVKRHCTNASCATMSLNCKLSNISDNVLLVLLQIISENYHDMNISVLSYHILLFYALNFA